MRFPQRPAPLHSSAPMRCGSGSSLKGRRCAAAAGISAFSLIELIVVVGLIVVLAGLGVFAFSNQGSSMAITTAASQVSTSVAGARQLAVSSNARTRFIILADSEENEQEWKLRT